MRHLIPRRPLLFLLLAPPAVAFAGEPFLEKADLFEANAGGYAHYRIPGLVVTAKGTLLAYCEARKSTKGDWGTIDILMRRSTDGGRSWATPRKIVTPPRDVAKNPVALAQHLAQPGEVTLNNPAAIAQSQTGAVHFLYCVEYARCFYQRSDDDGQSFTEPVEITSTFDRFRPEYPWKVLATGPGHGIRLTSGRLLVPIWLSTGTGGHAHRPSAVSVIYSDDHGKTWHRGQIVASHPNPSNPSETATVELADGRVMLNIRHESAPHIRAVSISREGATNWSPIQFDKALPEPICFGSLARLPKRAEGEKDRLLFVNPHNPSGRERRNLTVKLSDEDGKTWPVSRPIEPGLAGYADLAVGPDGTIFCLYERGTAGAGATNPRALCLARFNIEWLTAE
jgi:Neuraminidase (sialidase)